MPLARSVSPGARWATRRRNTKSKRRASMSCWRSLRNATGQASVEATRRGYSSNSTVGQPILAVSAARTLIAEAAASRKRYPGKRKGRMKRGIPRSVRRLERCQNRLRNFGHHVDGRIDYLRHVVHHRCAQYGGDFRGIETVLLLQPADKTGGGAAKCLVQAAGDAARHQVIRVLHTRS